MTYDGIIKGATVDLASVLEKDAEFILELRVNKETSKFLHPTENNLEKQITWIITQQLRDNDYYFLILDKQGSPIGTISLYNIRFGKGEFGRWICTGNSLQALESVLLLHDFGFFFNELDIIYSYTNSLNHKVINFNKNFGATFQNRKFDKQDNGNSMRKAIILSSEYPAIRKKNSLLIDKLL